MHMKELLKTKGLTIILGELIEAVGDLDPGGDEYVIQVQIDLRKTLDTYGKRYEQHDHNEPWGAGNVAMEEQS